MYVVQLHTEASFDGPFASVGHEVLKVLLESLVQIDVALMRSIPFPELYRTGVRYRQEPLGQEKWRDAAIVLRTGYGDCEDLAAYRTAELRVRHNIPARCVFRWKTLVLNRDGIDRKIKLYHIMVGVPHQGKLLIEDPSKRLGMPASAPEQSMTG